MNLVTFLLIVLIVLALGGGGWGHYVGGYNGIGGIDLGGVLINVLVVLLVTGGSDVRELDGTERRAGGWRRFPSTRATMAIKALNDRKKLTADFNEANDAFIDEVLGALRAGRIDPDLARAYLAHPIAMMHADGAQAVADYFERMLAQRPDIDWTPG